MTSSAFRLYSLLFSLSGILIFASCASKETEAPSTNLAANRQMGLGLKSLKLNGANVAADYYNYISQLSLKAVSETYGAKVIQIPLVEGPIETIDNLYQIGKSEIDDFFVLEGNITGGFDTVGTTTAPEGTVVEDALDLSVTVYNGSNLKPVAVFRMKVPTKPRDVFESTFQEIFKKTALKSLANPNIYPKSDPQYFANLVYVFSEQQEKEQTETLTCENAPQKLKYYLWSKQLYDIVVARGVDRVVGTQGEAHQMTTRQTDSAAKAKVLDDCSADAGRAFEVQFDFGSINPDNHVFIRKAYEEVGFEPLLKQYTSKPVKFRFQVQDNKLSLFLEIRFDRLRYRAWTANRIPGRAKNFQILSLDPYYALMQKMVVFRGALPANTAPSLRGIFENMKMNLTLKTLINGEVSFSVDGTHRKDQQSMSMAYPNSVYISQPGLDNRLITNKDPQIFQEKGWIALGNCKTIEGAKTEDGLLYDFFGFPCQ